MINDRDKWPKWIATTLNTLAGRPGRFAFIERNEFTNTSIDALVEENVRYANVGKLMTATDTLTDEISLADQLRGVTLLLNLGILFDKQCPIDPLRLLRHLSHSEPRIASWPGIYNESRFEYGSGSSNHRFTWAPENVLFLTPVKRAYPDEVPFNEKWMN